MSLKLENSHGDIGTSSLRYQIHLLTDGLGVEKEHQVACGKVGEMGGGAYSLPFLQDQTGRSLCLGTQRPLGHLETTPCCYSKPSAALSSRKETID